MLNAILRIQWKACRHVLAALCLAGFALPMVSVRVGWKWTEANLPRFLTEMELWGFFYPGLAAVVALVLAVAIWSSDRKGQHVYALILPLPRWRYVLLRYGAGVILLMPIVLALWLGAMVATLGVNLPPGLRLFPHALALKFAIVLLLLFGFAFAAAAASRRTIAIGMRALGLFLALHIAVILLRPQTNLLWTVVSALAQWPGPLAPLGGRWMLIDV
jgi:ABC-type transport system involved in multi-copper enzyme maturation permease subunit